MPSVLRSAERENVPTCQKKIYDCVCRMRAKAPWYRRETQPLNDGICGLCCGYSSGVHLMLHVTGVPGIWRDIRITFSLYSSSYFILQIKQFYYYATCCCAFLTEIQRDSCTSPCRTPSDSP